MEEKIILQLGTQRNTFFIDITGLKIDYFRLWQIVSNKRYMKLDKTINTTAELWTEYKKDIEKKNYTTIKCFDSLQDFIKWAE